MPTDVSERCNVIEECYEFLLAYAAQGLPTDQGSKAGGEVRGFLGRAVQALTGLAETCAATAREEGLEPAQRYEAFFKVLARDASDSLAIIELVLAQPAISSQLVDNLNASIHLRALLTDLFIVDEVLRTRPEAAVRAARHSVESLVPSYDDASVPSPSAPDPSGSGR